MSSSQTYRTHLLTLALLLLLGMTSCSGKEADVPRIDHSDWVAIAGQDTIDVAEFSQRYITSAIVGGGKAARVDFLKALVIEKLLAQYAVEKGLDSSRYALRMQQQLSDEAVVEAYLAKEVDARINVDEEEMRRDFLRIIRSLTLDSWAFTDSIDAYRAFANVVDSVEFEEIATPDMRTGSRIFLKDQLLQYGQASPTFEETAYSLELGDISEPFFSDGRWWILRLVKFKQDRIPSEAAFASFAPTLKSTILRRHRGPVQHELIREVMRGKQLHIEPAPFQALAHALEERLPERTDLTEAPPSLITAPNPAIENVSLETLDPDQPLLTVSGEDGWTWTVREALERLATLPIPLERQPETSIQTTVGNALVWMVEFQTLADAAREAGFEEQQNVIRQREMWIDNALSMRGYSAFANSGWRVDGETEAADSSRSDLDWLDRLAEENPVRFDLKRLGELKLETIPVLVRKTHFPNRLGTPYPIGYEMALRWDPKSSSSN